MNVGSWSTLTKSLARSMLLPSSRHLLALAIAAFVKNAGSILSSRFPCSCSDIFNDVMSNYDLLQQGSAAATRRKPKDCTCITGMKTYPTTPRETLESMGTVAVRGHLDKCRNEQKAMEEQLEYQNKAGAAQVEGVEESYDRLNSSFATMKDNDEKSKKTAEDEMEKLKTDIGHLRGNKSEAESEYKKAFTEWFKLTGEVNSLTGELGQCKCKGTVFLSDANRHRFTAASDAAPAKMIKEVEDCENEVIKLQDKVEEKLAKARKETIEVTANIDRKKKQIADHQRLTKILNSASRLPAFREERRILEGAVYSEEMRVKNYKRSNKDLADNVEKLKQEKTKCGC